MNDYDIKAVIFDMGGVLLRTINAEPRENIASRFGVTRSELEAFVFSSKTSIQSELGRLSDVEHWREVIRHFHQTDINFLPLYDEYFSGDVIDQELLSFASSLKPDFKIGLLSNAWENARVLLSERFNFLDIFDESIFSSEIRVRKPDAGMYHSILTLLQVNPEEALFIDDVAENVDGARSVGMLALQYLGTSDTISAIKSLLGI